MHGAHLAEIPELLLIANVVEPLHEGRAPGVELDALNVVDNLVYQPAPRVLVLHLVLLQVFHDFGDKALNRHHDDHDDDACHHGPSHEFIERDHADDDLKRGRPGLLDELCEILEALDVHCHVIDYVARRL